MDTSVFRVTATRTFVAEKRENNADRLTAAGAARK